MIKGADRDNRVTISKIEGTIECRHGMAAEVIGACVFTEILYLVFNKSQSVQSVNRCIDKTLDKQ